MKTLIISIGLALGAFAGVSQFLLSEGELIGRIAALQKQQQQAEALAAKLPELKAQINSTVAKATEELRDKKLACSVVDKMLQTKIAAYGNMQQERLAAKLEVQPVDQLVEEIVNKADAWEEWQLPPFITESEKALLKKHWK